MAQADGEDIFTKQDYRKVSKFWNLGDLPHGVKRRFRVVGRGSISYERPYLSFRLTMQNPQTEFYKLAEMLKERKGIKRGIVGYMCYDENFNIVSMPNLLFEDRYTKFIENKEREKMKLKAMQEKERKEGWK